MQYRRGSFSNVLLLVVLGVLASCTPQKKLVYLQDKEGSATQYDTLPAHYKLQEGDMVNLDIWNVDIESSDIIDQTDRWNRIRARAAQNVIGSPQMYISSYAINDSGYVKVPVLGSIKLAGMTVEEANKRFQKKVDKYLKDAIAQLRLVNFRVNLLGEVNRPGTYTVFQPSVNILELVSAAGDMTPYGNREEVMLIRNIKGKEKTILLDLTNRSVLQSPFFYLQPGDIVYVQPNRGAKTTGFATIPWGTIFSAVSSTILIINFVQ